MLELSPENYTEIDGDVVFFTNPGGIRPRPPWLR